MSAFPKADVQNVRAGGRPNVRFWPKADIRTESKWVSVNVCFGEKSGHSGPSDLASDPPFILEAKIPEGRRDRTIGRRAHWSWRERKQ